MQLGDAEFIREAFEALEEGEANLASRFLGAVVLVSLGSPSLESSFFFPSDSDVVSNLFFLFFPFFFFRAAGRSS